MGDDQAGLAIAERLRQRSIPGVAIVGSEAPGTALPAGLSEAVRLLVIIDAAMADERHPPGTFEFIQYRKHPKLVAARSREDTHSLNVNTGLRLAAALDRLPKDTWIYAIFGTNFDRCLDVSTEVDAGVGPLTERIERDVRQWLDTHASG
jgi:hydrogenase maturation protease